MAEGGEKAFAFAQELDRRLETGGKLWLFLDYDGTLKEFAPTPAHINPDPAIAERLKRLVKRPNLRISVISGRRLSHVRELIPIKGIIMAGTYGIELDIPEQGRHHPVAWEDIRPVLDELKPRWEELLQGREGFFLEDKGWALAIHGRRADPEEADLVLDRAEAILEERQPLDEFRVLGGYKFLEIGPKMANKGDTIEYLLEKFPLQDAQLVYIGDDDKDEEAFAVIQKHGGKAIVVSKEPRRTLADYRLENPAGVHRWLETLAPDGGVE